MLKASNAMWPMPNEIVTLVAANVMLGGGTTKSNVPALALMPRQLLIMYLWPASNAR